MSLLQRRSFAARCGGRGWPSCRRENRSLASASDNRAALPTPHVPESSYQNQSGATTSCSGSATIGPAANMPRSVFACSLALAACSVRRSLERRLFLASALLASRRANDAFSSSDRRAAHKAASTELPYDDMRLSEEYA